MAGLGMPALFDLYTNSRYSDFTITCGGQVFNAHKAIICPASPYFSALCKGNFEEQNSVDLKEESPEVVARVIHYLYFGDYHTGNEQCSLETHMTPRTVPSQRTELVRTEASITVFIDAALFKDKAKEEEYELLDTHFHVYQCANYLSLDLLRYDAAQKFIDLLSKPMSREGFICVLKMVYENTASEDLVLRAALTGMCAYNHRMLSQYPGVISIIKQHEPTAWNVACKVANAYQKLLNHELKRMALHVAGEGLAASACPNCSKVWKYEDLVINKVNFDGTLVHMGCSDKDCSGRQLVRLA